MLIFSKSTVYLSFLFALIVAPLSHAEPSKQLKKDAFSDPDLVSGIDKGFLNKPIVYDEKVANDVDVVISLGQQTYPALHKVIRKIANTKGIKIDLQQGSCGSTAKRLLKKSVDIGTYCCPPGKSDRLPGLKFNTIAISPVALATHKDNPINDVSIEDAKKIYSGKYVTWSEVPGYQSMSDKLSGERIQPVVRLHCKQRPGHWHSLLGGPDAISPRSQSVGTIPDMVTQVASNVSAIGYDTPYMLNEHKDKGALKILSIDGNDPEDINKLIDGAYPIYRTYSMTTWTNENNRNEKAEVIIAAIYEYIENEGEKISFLPASKLESAGWKFKNGELIAEPNGQDVISEH